MKLLKLGVFLSMLMDIYVEYGFSKETTVNVAYAAFPWKRI